MLKIVRIVNKEPALKFENYKIESNIEVLDCFYHPVLKDQHRMFHDDNYQTLIFNDRLTTMLDIQHTSRAMLYRRKKVPKGHAVHSTYEGEQTCIWQFVRRINNFPILLVR